MAKAATQETAKNTSTDVEGAAQTPAAKPLKKAPAINMNRFGLESEYNQRWRATVPEGVVPEQVMDQGYWANVSMHFNPGDEITVMPDDGSWKMILQVIGCGKLFAHTVKLHFYDLQSAEPIVSLPSNYKIEFAGAHHKWRVIREGQPLRDNFRTRSEAAKWASNHEAAVNR